MKSIGLVLLASAVLFGQQRSGVGSPGVVVRSVGPSNFGSPTGIGNVVYPGTGHAPIIHSGVPNGYRSPGTVRPRTGGAVVYVPYAVGGYSYYGPPADPGVSMVYPGQGPQSPTVIINQTFVPQTATPVVREYVPDANGGIQLYQPQADTAGANQTAPADNPGYLVAFKDHTIYAAVAYWVEGETLHYITSGNTHNQVSLDLVDRDLSARLNGERGVDFLLPPKK
jgi:hypothetical protein